MRIVVCVSSFTQLWIRWIAGRLLSWPNVLLEEFVQRGHHLSGERDGVYVTLRSVRWGEGEVRNGEAHRQHNNNDTKTNKNVHVA